MSTLAPCIGRQSLFIGLSLAELVFAAVCGLSLVALSVGPLLSACSLPAAVASLVQRTGSRVLGLQSLWRVGSAVVALGLWSAHSVVMPHRLRCPKVCGIILDQGSNPFSHTLTGGFFTTGPAGRPSVSFYGYC